MKNENAAVEIGFEAILERLATLRLPHFDWVVGIARGGIVPAGLLSYQTGSDLRILGLNYRDDANRPRYDEPRLTGEFRMPENSGGQPVLLVDDASVTGKTLESAKQMLSGCRVTTLVLKGKADYVLFPEIDSCVRWPWSNLNLQPKV